MRDDFLNELLERVNHDDHFRESLLRDPGSALAKAQFSASMQAVPCINGEDGLRRMAAGSQVQFRLWTWIKKTASRLLCGPGRTRSWECPAKP